MILSTKPMKGNTVTYDIKHCYDVCFVLKVRKDIDVTERERLKITLKTQNKGISALLLLFYISQSSIMSIIDALTWVSNCL